MSRPQQQRTRAPEKGTRTVLQPPQPRPLTVQVVLVWAGRVAGAALLAAMAGIHLYLWNTGYRTIPIIGPLFLANAVAGALLCLALLLSTRRALLLISAAGAALAAGTLVGLILSVTSGLFGFTESLQAQLTTPSIATEAAAIVILGGLAGYEAAHHSRFMRLPSRTR
ncbi:MAG: hypothetical protein M3Z00_07205 [Actinomycetota bacterium]|nr:hypothetical protein [Actinomycetota bacterium]